MRQVQIGAEELRVAGLGGFEMEEPPPAAHRHHLGRGQLEQPLGAAGDAEAALPAAAERQAGVGRGHDQVVDHHHPGAHPCRQRDRRLLGPEDRGAEGIGGAGGLGERLVDVGDRE